MKIQHFMLLGSLVLGMSGTVTAGNYNIVNAADCVCQLNLNKGITHCQLDPKLARSIYAGVYVPNKQSPSHSEKFQVTQVIPFGTTQPVSDNAPDLNIPINYRYIAVSFRNDGSANIDTSRSSQHPVGQDLYAVTMNEGESDQDLVLFTQSEISYKPGVFCHWNG